MGSEQPLGVSQLPLSPLANRAATQAILARHGLATKHSLGQNFLVNDAIVRKTLVLADVQQSDHVLEVGPGIGTLTCALLKCAGHVTSVELDVDLPAVLADTCAFAKQRFTLIRKDALDLTEADLSQLPSAPNKLVANLPYAVAARLLLAYVQRFSHLESATVMVQKEVADRIAASPGNKNYGAYTVKLSLYTRVAGRFAVAAGNFYPPPRVESTVVHLVRQTPQDCLGHALSFALRDAACTMADAAFANRRKTIENSCKTYFASRGKDGAQIVEHIPDLLVAAGIDAGRRGESLTQQEFIRLGEGLLKFRSC